MTYVPRSLTTEINHYLKETDTYNNTLLIAGARQTGKSTLIKESLKEKAVCFVNLFERRSLPEQINQVENFTDLERLFLRELNFKPSQNVILVIDEAQEAKRLGRWVRFFKEKWPHQKVILLGSILANLFAENIAYPVGRVEEIILRPFSFEEFLLATDREGLKEILTTVSFENFLAESDYKSFIKAYLEYLQVGGMPEIVKNFVTVSQDPSLAWEQLFRQYAIDVERYMKEIFQSLFLTAVERIAGHTCHPIKNSQIVSTDSPSYQKLPRLLEVLEKWHLILKSSIQTKHPESSTRVPGKRYLFDVGLANHLTQQNAPVTWKTRSEKDNIIYGKLQENFVACELLSLNPFSSSLKFYRETRNSQEIDFIFSSNKQKIPIEVKSQSSINRNSLLPIIHFLAQHDKNFGILVYNGPMTKLKLKNKLIYAIPPFCLNQILKNITAY